MADDGFVPDDGFVADDGFVPDDGFVADEGFVPETAAKNAPAAAPKYPMEPGLEAVQSGQGADVPEGYARNDIGEIFHKETGKVLPVTRRPSVLPVTKNAAGETELAVPKALEIAGSLVTPLRGIPKALPAVTSGPFGVTQTAGQAARYAGDEAAALPLIQKEQAAISGELGKPAQKRALEFVEQQKAQTAAAQDVAARGLDPLGRQIAETPHEAGTVVSNAVQNAAQQSKQAVKNAYTYAEGLGGEVHASAFENMGQGVKQRIWPEVVVNEKTTPVASQMVDYLDNMLVNSTKLNKANPFGAMNPETVSGVTLKGVDETRKILSKWRSDAYKPVADADTRASQAVLKAFDDHIDAAVNGGLFNGDARAVKSWNDARAANADYRSTFTAGKGDPVSRVVAKIIGDKVNPPEVANAVADHLYGASGITPGNLNVNVANRVKNILGANSSEWSAVKQGLFSRLTETPPGVTDWGPGRISQNINKFLEGKGKDLSSAVYTAEERTTLKNYADLMRSLEVPPRGANTSLSARGIAPMLQKIGNAISTAIGGVIGAGFGGMLGSSIGAGVGWGLGKTASAVGSRMEAAKIAKQMPLVTEQLKTYQKAFERSQSQGTAVSKTALTSAYVSLSNSLKSMGIDLNAIHGAVPAAAQPEQNKRYATGGSVFDKMHAAKHMQQGGGLESFIKSLGSQGAAFGTQTEQEQAGFQRDPISELGKGAYNAVEHLAKENIDNANLLATGNRDQFSGKPGFEAGMLTMGTGAVAGVPMRAGEFALGSGPIRAYHGSPHDFDKFDLAKIGTGEGAQAYGHGLYFAEKEGTARSYRDALSQGNPEIAYKGKPVPVYTGRGLSESGLPPEQYYASMFGPKDDPAFAREAHIKYLESQKRMIPTRDDLPTSVKDRALKGLDEQIAQISLFDPAAVEKLKQGHMYEVNINAKPEQFLDWDKPLSKQAPQAQDAFKQLGFEPNPNKYPSMKEAENLFNSYRVQKLAYDDIGTRESLKKGLDLVRAGDKTGFQNWFDHRGGTLSPGRHKDIRGQDLYYELGNKAGMADPTASFKARYPQASAQLNEAGIPGIKYLDQGSRGTSGGSSNYVVFDSNIIEIMKKYGMTLPAATAAYEAMKSNQEKTGFKKGGSVFDKMKRASK